MQVNNLGRVGMKREHKTLEFRISKDIAYEDRKDMAYELALENCPEGWVPDKYFSSQGSFFNKDGVEMARTTIRRWV